MYLIHYVIGVVICLMLVIIIIAYMSGSNVPKGITIPVILLLILHGIANVGLTSLQWKTIAIERTVSASISGGKSATSAWASLGAKLSKTASSIKDTTQGSLRNIANQTQELQTQVADTAGKLIDTAGTQVESSLKKLDEIAESKIGNISNQIDIKTKEALTAVDNSVSNAGGMGSFE
jgi:ElaB/YqjD/DUF883 family membrane-anchored ribosome-binding protein